MRSTLLKARYFSEKILDFLLPPHCLISGDVVDQQGMIAPQFWSQIHFIERPFCACCGVPFPHHTEDKTLCSSCIHDRPAYQACRSAIVYNAESKALILKLKYGDRLEVAPLLASWLQVAGVDLLKAADLLMPVPLHPLRRIKRKFNQSAVIARHLSAKTGISTQDGLLKRGRHTPPQTGDKKNRRKNVLKAFYMKSADIEHVKGKTVLLIDDVYTTGSTVNECAKVLLDYGARAVNVLTVSRVIYTR